jgi:hypothetical protein
MSTLAEQMEQDRKLLDTAEEIMEQDRKLLDTAEEIVEKITPLSKSPSEISAEAMLIRVDIETILISPNGKAGVLGGIALRFLFRQSFALGDELVTDKDARDKAPVMIRTGLAEHPVLWCHPKLLLGHLLEPAFRIGVQFRIEDFLRPRQHMRLDEGLSGPIPLIEIERSMITHI